jgi:hypothetical protein
LEAKGILDFSQQLLLLCLSPSNLIPSFRPIYLLLMILGKSKSVTKLIYLAFQTYLWFFLIHSRKYGDMWNWATNYLLTVLLTESFYPILEVTWSDNIAQYFWKYLRNWGSALNWYQKDFIFLVHFNWCLKNPPKQHISKVIPRICFKNTSSSNKAFSYKKIEAQQCEELTAVRTGTLSFDFHPRGLPPVHRLP